MLHERILRALYELFCLVRTGLQAVYRRVSPWVQEMYSRARPWVQEQLRRLWFGLKDQLGRFGAWLRELLSRIGARLHAWTTGGPPIQRGRRRRKRFYIYTPTEGRGKRLIMLGAGVVLIGILAFSATKLADYGMDYARSRQSAEELRRMYHETEETGAVTTAVPAETPVPASTEVPEEDAEAPVQTPVPTSAETPAEQTAAPVSRLAKVNYPDNPYRIVSERFQKIRRQNKDIIGWLTIDGLLDEVVVQRDNEYYLNRDYLGYHNVNGAIFLDENCDLSTRPYTLLLYGHNMKTGLMFGSLRNYEKLSFYRQNPFFSFDTMYENGRYVIFSVATISTVPSNWRYLNLSRLVSTSVSLRQEAIDQLKRFSVYMSSIEVLPEDQILLMVTCVDEDTDRRVIAARRIREDESEEELRRLVRVTMEK